ncbi:TIGR03749 family integrating conjugative element protein [Vibrio parahaemolyticus]|nr:TIGR03749 family integrating conjugative element protein [Vibrio parahaemolyticus]
MKKALFLLGVMAASSVQATEFLVWDKNAIPVAFQKGYERTIEFPSHVTIGVPSSLSGKVDANSSAGVVYFKPLAEFPETRFTFVLAESGQRIYLDISSRGDLGGSDPKEDIVVKLKNQHVKDSEEEFNKVSSVSGVQVSDLLRYASKDWYAPERLKTSVLGIGERNVGGEYELDYFWMGASAGAYSMKPIKEYFTSDYTLTALLLENRGLQVRTVDYSHVYPGVKAVSSQHMWLGPKGTPEATTILYVINEGRSFLKSEVYAK